MGGKVDESKPETKPLGSYWYYLFDALYMNIMTFSSVGYGDYSPSTQWGKALSPINMQLGTFFFNRAASALNGDDGEHEEAGKAFTRWYTSCLPKSMADRIREEELEEEQKQSEAGLEIVADEEKEMTKPAEVVGIIEDVFSLENVAFDELEEKDKLNIEEIFRAKVMNQYHVHKDEVEINLSPGEGTSLLQVPGRWHNGRRSVMVVKVIIKPKEGRDVYVGEMRGSVLKELKKELQRKLKKEAIEVEETQHVVLDEKEALERERHEEALERKRHEEALERERHEVEPLGEQTDEVEPLGEQTDEVERLGEQTDEVERLGEQTDEVERLGAKNRGRTTG